MSDLDGGHSDDRVVAARRADGDCTDIELVAQALHDRTAFATLYRRHLPRVYRYALAHLGDVQSAQEITSQTFLAALEGLATYHAKGAFIAWLLRIARNKIADARRTTRPLVPLETVAELPAGSPSPERVALARLELEEATRVLRVLAPERAEALALRLFAGLNNAEIGEVMGKSEDAVKMLVHRAIHDLRQRLAPHSEADT